MDHACKLIHKETHGRDKYGNPVEVTVEREVLCQLHSVTRSEFYSAATANLHPEYIVRLSDFAEYQGEKLVEIDGELYSVIRTYRDRGSMGHNAVGVQMPQDANALELTVGRKIGNE